MKKSFRTMLILVVFFLVGLMVPPNVYGKNLFEVLGITKAAPLPRMTIKVDNLDSTNLSQRDNVTFILTRDQVVSKQQTWTKNGVTLDCAGFKVESTVGWVTTQYQVKGDDCGILNGTISGHDGGEFVKVLGAKRFQYVNITQVENSTGGGIGPITTDGSEDLLISNLKTQHTGRYSWYLGNGSGKKNTRFQIVNCKLGPSILTEDRKYNGRPNGVLSEHNGRAYGINQGLILNCEMHNQDNPDGKQSLKAMEGDGLLVVGCTMDGSRWGRDINDPQSYKLTNVMIFGCKFNQWFRVDKGASVTMMNSALTIYSSGSVFDMQPESSITLNGVDARYKNGGKFASDSSKVHVVSGVTFNGKPVP